MLKLTAPTQSALVALLLSFTSICAAAPSAPHGPAPSASDSRERSRGSRPDLYTPVLYGFDSVTASSGAGNAAPVDDREGWDGQSIALASQEFPDAPDASTRVFDDFRVREDGLEIKRIVVRGVERGDSAANRAVRLQIQSEPCVDQPGSVLVSANGQQQLGDLVFEFDPPVRIATGTYWLTAWVERAYSSGNQWFWLTSRGISGQPAQIQVAGRSGRARPRSQPAGDLLGESVDAVVTVESVLGGQCGVDVSWSFKRARITTANSVGLIRVPLCDPLPLGVDALDEHYFYHRCSSCGVDQNVEVMHAKVSYSWSISSGGGHFTRVTDSNSGVNEDIQQVLYVPPSLAPGESTTAIVVATAYHDDPTKLPATHNPAIATFTINITHDVVTDQYTVGGVPVSESRHELVYDVSVEKTPAPGTPILAVTGPPYCSAVTHKGVGSDITGSFVPVTADIQAKDYVVLIADATDTDDFELDCVGDLVHCLLGTTSFSLNDNLKFTWSASEGEFPAGNVGREIVYKAPEDAGQVIVTLVITDTGTRFTDAGFTVSAPLDITRTERTGSFAAVAWIDASTIAVPANDVRPPAPDPAGFAWKAPHLISAIVSDAVDPNPRAQFAYLTNVPLPGWQLFVAGPGGPVHEASIHPWMHAIRAVRASANPPPPGSFDSFEDITDWMSEREFRGVLGGKVKALRRRSCLLDFSREAADFSLVVDPGWTPIPDTLEGLAGQLAARLLYGITFGDYSRGVNRNKSVTITGINRDAITIDVRQEFRVGEDGNFMNNVMTNRNAPWISGHVVFTLRAASDPTSADLTFASSPQFPSWTTYYGKTWLPSISTSPPGEPIVNFIDRGSKVEPRGP